MVEVVVEFEVEPFDVFERRDDLEVKEKIYLICPRPVRVLGAHLL